MANEKQMDSELIEELQQRLEALNNEGVMDAGVIDGFLTAYALNPEHPSKHDIYPYIFSEEGDPAALPEDDRILELRYATISIRVLVWKCRLNSVGCRIDNVYNNI